MGWMSICNSDAALSPPTAGVRPTAPIIPRFSVLLILCYTVQETPVHSPSAKADPNVTGESAMNILLAIIIFSYVYYHLILFARQEEIEEQYTEAITDIEGRLDWASTRSRFPFGMRAQMQVSQERLRKAKELWQRKQFQQAYRMALQSQEAMDKAQRIYVHTIKRL